MKTSCSTNCQTRNLNWSLNYRYCLTNCFDSGWTGYLTSCWICPCSTLNSGRSTNCHSCSNSDCCLMSWIGCCSTPNCQTTGYQRMTANCYSRWCWKTRCLVGLFVGLDYFESCFAADSNRHDHCCADCPGCLTGCLGCLTGCCSNRDDPRCADCLGCLTAGCCSNHDDHRCADCLGCVTAGCLNLLT